MEGSLNQVIKLRLLVPADTNQHWQYTVLSRSLVKVSCLFRNLALKKTVHQVPPMSCHKDSLKLIQHATSSFPHLAWMQLIACIVILFTLHSPSCSGWTGCVLEHSKHQTQMGTKSHYFPAGYIMAQIRGETGIFLLGMRRKKKKNQKPDFSIYGKLAHR